MATQKKYFIPGDVLQTIKAQADIVSVVQRRVPDLKKKGRNFVGCCPFHNEKSASFTVEPTAQFYHCFGCGANGSVIDFVMEHDMLDFSEAVESLCDEIGFPLASHVTQYRTPPVEKDIYTFQQSAAAYFEDNLTHHQADPAKAYLAKEGISEDIASTYGVGFAINSRNDLKHKLGGSKKAIAQLIDCGVVWRVSGKLVDRFSNRLMFNILDRGGRAIGFGSTDIPIPGYRPMYVTSVDNRIFQSGKELYGFHQMRQSNRNLDEIYVVRDYLDVVRLASRGITNVVCPPGGSITKDQLARLVRCAPVIRFVFNENSDDRQYAWEYVENALPVLGGDYEFSFSFLPEGVSVSSLLAKDVSSFTDTVQANAKPFSRFFLEKLNERIAEEDDWATKIEALAAPYLKLIKPGVYKQLLTQEVLGAFSPPILYEANELRFIQDKTDYQAPPSLIKDTIESKVLLMLVNTPDLAHELPDEELLSNLTSPEGVLLSDMSNYLADLNFRDIPASTGMIIEHFRDHKLAETLAQMALQDHDLTFHEMVAYCERLAINAQDDVVDDVDAIFDKPVSELTDKDREKLRRAKALPNRRRFA